MGVVWCGLSVYTMDNNTSDGNLYFYRIYCARSSHSYGSYNYSNITYDDLIEININKNEYKYCYECHNYFCILCADSMKGPCCMYCEIKHSEQRRELLPIEYSEEWNFTDTETNHL